jgi:hypothetical protein
VKKLTLNALLVLVVLAMAAAPATAQDTFNCGNFVHQGQAQETFGMVPSDPNGLDAGNDGIACEELPVVTNQAGAADERCELEDRIARLRRKLRASRRRSRPGARGRRS